MKSVLSVNSSPHIKHVDTTSSIMLDVIIALLPAAVFGCVMFGIRAVILLLLCVTTAVLFETLWCLILKKPISAGDFSAVVTGLLLGMNLPSSLPVWMAPIGTLVAIIVVKQMFGGIGHNFVNPALAARIVLMVSFPSYMSASAFLEPSVATSVDTVAAATPLAILSGEEMVISFNDLFFGRYAGCIGETSSFLLIIGGIYLVIRRVISPIIPVSFIGTVAVATLISGDNLWVALFGGGLMLGAIFMATDYVTSPTGKLGKLIFGIGCGLITFVIRKFAALPEGVSYAILIMNILVPHINKLTMRKPFGYVKEGK